MKYLTAIEVRYFRNSVAKVNPVRLERDTSMSVFVDPSNCLYVCQIIAIDGT